MVSSNVIASRNGKKVEISFKHKCIFDFDVIQQSEREKIRVRRDKVSTKPEGDDKGLRQTNAGPRQCKMIEEPSDDQDADLKGRARKPKNVQWSHRQTRFALKRDSDERTEQSL